MDRQTNANAVMFAELHMRTRQQALSEGRF